VSRQYPRTQPLTGERARELAADPARRCLVEQMLSTTTREEIAAAREAQWAWLMANPDAFGVLEAGEDLVYAEDAPAPLEATQVLQPGSG
jgi:hypothetical protein